MNGQQRRALVASLTNAQKDNLQQNLVLPSMNVSVPGTFGAAEGLGKSIRIKPGARLTLADLERHTASARGEIHLLGTLSNLMAEYALGMAADALKATELYRHAVKKAANDTRAGLERWKAGMPGTLGTRWDAAFDLCTDRMGARLQQEADLLQVQFAAVMNRRRHPRAELVGWAELARLLFNLSGRVVENRRAEWEKATGADFGGIFAHFNLAETCGRRWAEVCAALYTDEDRKAMGEDRNCYNALAIYARDACDLDALSPHIRDLAEGEYRDEFTDKDREAIAADCEQAAAERAAEKAEAEKANADYWRNKRKRQRKAAAQVTDEDISQLAEHFKEWGGAASS